MFKVTVSAKARHSCWLLLRWDDVMERVIWWRRREWYLAVSIYDWNWSTEWSSEMNVCGWIVGLMFSAGDAGDESCWQKRSGQGV